MKKYSLITLLIVSLLLLLSVNKDMSDIKYVKGTHIVKKQYTPVINVSGEFDYTDKTDILLGFPLFIKDVYIKENIYVTKGQALFSVDRAKMASMLSEGSTEELAGFFEISDLSSFEAPMTTFKQEDIINIPDVVYSPENGIVETLNIFPGSISLPDQKLVSISHTDEIVAKFSLSQLDYGKINIGDKVEIKPVAFSYKKYTGTISDNNTLIKKQNSLTGSKTVIEVSATIDNTDKYVCDGLGINGVVYCGPSKRINTLNYDFVYQDGKEQFVYILYNGKAEKRKINTGIEADNYTQILTEFSPDTIFLSGDLKEGDRIVIVG